MNNIKPTNYIVLTQPLGGHTYMGAYFLTYSQAKKLLKDESVVIYIFKILQHDFVKNPLLKFPLFDYYSCLEINNFTNDVKKSLDDDSLKNNDKNFSEYIELKKEFNNDKKEWDIEIIHHLIE